MKDYFTTYEKFPDGRVPPDMVGSADVVLVKRIINPHYGTLYEIWKDGHPDPTDLKGKPCGFVSPFSSNEDLFDQHYHGKPIKYKKIDDEYAPMYD